MSKSVPKFRSGNKSYATGLDEKPTAGFVLPGKEGTGKSNGKQSDVAPPDESKKQQSAFRASDLLNQEIAEIPCLIPPILPKVGLIAIAGGSDTGKSSLLRQLAISNCTGKSKFLGWDLKSEHKRAIYVSSEDDEYAIAHLLHRANTELQIPNKAFEGLTFIFNTTDLIYQLDDHLSKEQVDLVVVDCFSDLYSRSMNDSNQVRTFLNEYSQLAQFYKCLIIFLHHTGKRTEELSPSKHNLLGSQGFEAKMRLVMELRSDLTEADKRHLCIVKGNYLPKEFKTESYVLEFNQNLLFTTTGERKPFDELADSKPLLKDTVKKLHDESKTQIEIAKLLKISQATVSRYLKK
jgi:RecA-family ATPase